MSKMDAHPRQKIQLLDAKNTTVGSTFGNGARTSNLDFERPTTFVLHAGKKEEASEVPFTSFFAQDPVPVKQFRQLRDYGVSLRSNLSFMLADN